MINEVFKTSIFYSDFFMTSPLGTFHVQKCFFPWQPYVPSPSYIPVAMRSNNNNKKSNNLTPKYNFHQALIKKKN